jgi:hypothetical protein
VNTTPLFIRERGYLVRHMSSMVGTGHMSSMVGTGHTETYPTSGIPYGIVGSNLQKLGEMLCLFQQTGSPSILDMANSFIREHRDEYFAAATFVLSAIEKPVEKGDGGGHHIPTSAFFGRPPGVHTPMSGTPQPFAAPDVVSDAVESSTASTVSIRPSSDSPPPSTSPHPSDGDDRTSAYPMAKILGLIPTDSLLSLSPTASIFSFLVGADISVVIDYLQTMKTNRGERAVRVLIHHTCFLTNLVASYFYCPDTADQLCVCRDAYTSPIASVWAAYIKSFSGEMEDEYDSSINGVKDMRSSVRAKISETFASYRSDVGFTEILGEGCYVASGDRRQPNSLPVPHIMPIRSPAELQYRHLNALQHLETNRANELTLQSLLWESASTEENIDARHIFFGSHHSNDWIEHIDADICDNDIKLLAELLQCHCHYIQKPFNRLRVSSGMTDDNVVARFIIWTLIVEVAFLRPSIFSL